MSNVTPIDSRQDSPLSGFGAQTMADMREAHNLIRASLSAWISDQLYEGTGAQDIAAYLTQIIGANVLHGNGVVSVELQGHEAKGTTCLMALRNWALQNRDASRLSEFSAPRTADARFVDFLNNLGGLDMGGQVDAVMREAMETNGRFEAPDGQISHLWEITLHGITAQAADEESVIDAWKRLARQRIEDTGGQT